VSSGEPYLPRASYRLVLIGLSADCVSLALQLGGETRKVAVLVGSGRNWYEATRFPHNMTDEGASTGDDKLDREIRQRAAEELIRLAAAKEACEWKKD
jgi:hypothetical protein